MLDQGEIQRPLDFFRLTLSNLACVTGLAKTTKQAFAFAIIPTVGQSQKGGSSATNSSCILFSVEESEALFPLVGSFGYNRRAQYLMAIVSRLVVNAPDLPNKINVQERRTGLDYYFRYLVEPNIIHSYSIT